jgi:hypothetical protein
LNVWEKESMLALNIQAMKHGEKGLMDNVNVG